MIYLVIRFILLLGSKDIKLLNIKYPPNIHVVSEGQPKPVTTTRTLPKGFGSRCMSWQSQAASRLLFLFTDRSLSDMRYLDAKLVNYSENIATAQLENLGVEY